MVMVMPPLAGPPEISSPEIPNPEARGATPVFYPSPTETTEWRRRALEQQVATASFPAGSDAAALMYLWLTVAIAAVAVLGISALGADRVPTAVLDSQLDLVDQIARGVNGSSARANETFDRVVAGLRVQPPPDQPAQLLAPLLGDSATWSGGAVVATASRRILLTQGTEIPADLLPWPLPDHATTAVTVADGPALMYEMALDGTRTVVALHPLRMRNLRLNPDAQQGVFVVTRDGQRTLVQGVSALPLDRAAAALSGLAGRSRVSRTIAVKEWPGRRLVVSAAPVGATGVVVVSMIVAETYPGTSVAYAALLGGSLLATGGLAFLLMQAALSRQLRLVSQRVVAEACGVRPPDRRLPWTGEARRIAQAVGARAGETCPRRWSPSALLGLLLAACVSLAWPAAAAAAVAAEPHAVVPSQLASDEESRAEAASATLGNALGAGLTVVQQLAVLRGNSPPSLVDPLLDRSLRAERRLRALYMADRKGTVVASAGRMSLRTPHPLPGLTGVEIDRSVTRLPVVYAYQATGDGFAIVGEFDIGYLIGLLRDVDRHATVVDTDLRTVLASYGYRAFQPLRGATAREAAVAASGGGTVGRSRTPDGKPALVAAATVVAPDPVAHLEWIVVVERSVAALRLPELAGQRLTLVVAFAVVLVTALILLWQIFVFIRPLRRLAASADRMRSGHLDEPIAPQRHDDVGAIAVCLEICRQVRHSGSARFGGAGRLRGPEVDATAVLPPVPASDAGE